MVSQVFVAAVAAGSLFSTAAAIPGSKTQSSTPTYTGALHSMKSKGCFSSSEPLEDQGSYTFQTQGNCQPICVGLEYTVMALVNGSNCFCGNKIPSKDTLVDDDKCNTPCNGYDQDNCGGNNYWMVYTSGLNNNEVEYYDGDSSSSSSSSSTSSTQGTPVVVTVGGGQTIVVTKGAEASATSSSSSDGPSKAGIAAGVVVGVVVMTAIIGGVILFLRHRRRKQVEEEYRQRQSMNNFVANGGKAPGANPMNDTILDPAFARRMSNGSVADNQDYSRRILQVRNPDDD